MMTEHIPPENTPAYVDYLLDSLEAEVRLSERYSVSLESINFYKGLIHTTYQWALDRKDEDHERIRTEAN